MFIHNIDPVLLSVGPFEIHYYGLFFVLGFVLAYFIINYLAKRKELPLSKDDIADLILYVIVGVVLGARIFYVFVYNLPFYLNNPSQIIAIWNGGLSFHGGLIGAVIVALIFCKKKKIHFYELADIAVVPLALGLALGRLGNFTNGELYGRITNVPWAMKFQDAEGFRHPSQLYASFKDLVIFFTLWVIKDKKMPKGFIFWLFVVMYSAFRFTVEFFRQPDEQLGFIIGFLSMGQILSIIMFLVGVVFIYRVSRKNT
ncbi:MAG: prolipoprotein diacylglyceryl transferase [Candidatus Woesearchaeota archaeon]|jgi:phosphatidylglycerol:prolipoprotein diacylglycerol transferase|nr:prolipoprotein diacylglyceryl transferase [Candidatus Woesearchaeota archaeon]MDP7622849.1 prolipoprotein diacylglyceryl transferase [Candidatus Woesearchaeota archaeon]HJN56891.1 prolipoprotein diacylglyceryl transferase [Candidatus Woesearchaeota archaeon]|tara:strand:- start:35796 stop:36566 length:771 start_codon:yes stop_codon:yes gene_type:complete